LWIQVDDYRSTNPPTHPQLLQRLAKNFADSGYDLKKAHADDRAVTDVPVVQRALSQQ
jgi:hypothetical protein